MTTRYLPFVLLALVWAGCDRTPEDTLPEDPAERAAAGGATTIHYAGNDAFTLPIANLLPENSKRHLDADGLFAQNFVTEPSPAFGGLGPVYNALSCGSCHVRNGRSRPPVGPTDFTGLLLRLSVPGTAPDGGPLAAPGFGGQLQNRAILGTSAEGLIGVRFLDTVITFTDGSKHTLRTPVYSVESPYTALPAGLMVSPRNAPPVFGLGLLEAIPEASLLAREDPADADGDGISGRANRVWDIAAGKTAVGRFGWKAGQPSGRQQAAGAYHGDMGITSPLFPVEECDGQANCVGTDGKMDITNDDLDLVTFYFQTLAVPAAREVGQHGAGWKLFADLGCASCHVPKQQTGSFGVKELENQTIYPYTDLLLHDMGPGLTDGRPDYLAAATEWRTPALWGLGLTNRINGGWYLLHDGRARTIEEAILWHGGEAEKAQQRYKALSPSERGALIAFLESL